MVARSRGNDSSEEPMENDEDIVHIYGTTIESTPLKPKLNSISDDSVVVKIEDKYKEKFLERLKIPYDTVSKDSDSLIQDIYYQTEKYDSHLSWWNHPKVRQNWKIVLAAFVLLVLGVGLVATGILVEIMPIPGFKGFVFFIAGAICFIPGAYHVVYVYCAVKGRRGFDFHSLPLFN